MGDSVTKRQFWSGDELKPHSNTTYMYVVPSNIEGKLGAGFAGYAVKHLGAIYGQSEGLSGERCYLLPTKSLKTNKALSHEAIRAAIQRLYDTARRMPDCKFFVPYTAQGKNLIYMSTQDIISLFLEVEDVPINIVFHNSVKGQVHQHLSRKHKMK